MPEDTTDLLLLNPVHEWDHIRGSADAPFTLVEYGDYQCPDCGRLFETLQSVQQDFGTRLRLVYRHYPLSGIHKHAQMAAEAVEAASAQGRFWEMHDLLFQNQNALEEKHLLQYAAQLEYGCRSLPPRSEARIVRGTRPARLHRRCPERRKRHSRTLPERSPPAPRLRPAGINRSAERRAQPRPV